MLHVHACVYPRCFYSTPTSTYVEQHREFTQEAEQPYFGLSLVTVSLCTSRSGLVTHSKTAAHLQYHFIKLSLNKISTAEHIPTQQSIAEHMTAKSEHTTAWHTKTQHRKVLHSMTQCYHGCSQLDINIQHSAKCHAEAASLMPAHDTKAS